MQLSAATAAIDDDDDDTDFDFVCTRLDNIVTPMMT